MTVIQKQREKRVRRILKLLGRGLTPTEVAKRLDIDSQLVHYYKKQNETNPKNKKGEVEK